MQIIKKSEVKGQKSEIRGQNAEVGGQKSIELAGGTGRIIETEVQGSELKRPNDTGQAGGHNQSFDPLTLTSDF